MLYFLYGDIQKAKEKSKKMLRAQMQKDINATQFLFNEDNFTAAEVSALSQSGALFQSKIVVVIDRIFSNKKFEEDAHALLDSLSESDNIFIIIESELPKLVKTKIEKKAEKTEIFESKEKQVKERQEFPIFSLADALGARDRKRLWTLYVKAISSGVESEEVHRILLWQLKAIILANASKNAGEAGLAPFVYSKSSRYAKSFSKEELNKLSWELVEMYHESRRGEDLASKLELWILKI
jgi:DNA polymerase III delta subunit